MAAGESVKVSVVTDRSPCTISCSLTAEELCIILCKKYNIPPLTRTLFALRVKGTDYFLKDNCKVLSSTRDYELRIRFKVPRLGQLITLDEVTYDYYFQQARNDINENKIPEIKYPERKQELLGLGIIDMTRAVLEDKIPQNEVKRNYKKYIPKIIVRRHGPFVKKYVHDFLPRICSGGHNVNYIKRLYLEQLHGLAPNYLAEEYGGVRWHSGEEVIPIRLVVAPFHPHQPGIRLYNTVRRDWLHVCTIEELIYLTRNGDNVLEVSRRGTPLFFKFKSEEQLSSFISVCDGYYRLMVKWTFNLSKDDETPSLKELHRIKCHGPVGGAFSYRKLEEKRSKKHGCFIMRQCQDDYNVYYLDVCTKNSTTETYRIEFKGHGYILQNQEYYSMETLVSCHKEAEGRIYLNECIPPSEYDKSQLLLCGEPQKKGVRIDQAELQEILKDNKCPRCLLNKDILLYTGAWCYTSDDLLLKDLCDVPDCDVDGSRIILLMPGSDDQRYTYLLPQWRTAGSEKIGSDNITATYKALWKLDETKKLQVAFKTLIRDKEKEYLKELMDLAGTWACVQSSSIVRLYGVTLSSPTALVLEYIPYGPFDDYLREHRESVLPIHLKKVSANLSRALWDLSESGVVHGNIRCRRLLLAAHDGERVVVKLSGPSLRQYTAQDVHWIPVEFYSDMSVAKRSVMADIWAFATTLWEVFSFGQKPTETNPVLTARSYEMGDRLLRPACCPNEVWSLMRQCWQSDPPRPQEIMRDMNHMLHSEYLPVHPYEEPNISIEHMDQPDTVASDMTFIPSEISDVGSNKSLISDSSMPSNGTDSEQFDNPFGDNKSCYGMENMDALMYALRSEDASAAPPDDDWRATPRLMESIVSQGKTYLVTLQKKIGSGNYGHVYKGWMESDNQESHGRDVAVKKLTRQESENGTLFEDFKNELMIMKSLQHANIVEILGSSSDHGSDVLIVMEYLEQGSLSYYLKFQGDKLRISHLLKYAMDIASGMDYMSSKGVVHRDLAARNILVHKMDHVKIADFGLARVVPKHENAYRIKTARHLPFNWYAPESAVEPWHFSTQSDVWSYGVTVWEIFTRSRQEVPKFDLDRPKERASCFQIPENCPSEIYRHLMKECWNLDQRQRPKFIDLVYMCKRLREEYK